MAAVPPNWGACLPRAILGACLGHLGPRCEATRGSRGAWGSSDCSPRLQGRLGAVSCRVAMFLSLCDPANAADCGDGGGGYHRLLTCTGTRVQARRKRHGAGRKLESNGTIGQCFRGRRTGLSLRTWQHCFSRDMPGCSSGQARGPDCWIPEGLRLLPYMLGADGPQQLGGPVGRSARGAQVERSCLAR